MTVAATQAHTSPNAPTEADRRAAKLCLETGMSLATVQRAAETNAGLVPLAAAMAELAEADPAGQPSEPEQPSEPKRSLPHPLRDLRTAAEAYERVATQAGADLIELRKIAQGG